jgi:hypothetical protein
MRAHLTGRAIALAIVATLAVIALAIVRPWDRSDGETAADISLDDLYARMHAALAPVDGSVAHVRTVSRYDNGEYRRERVSETWIDVAGERLRTREEVPPRSPPLPQPGDQIQHGLTVYYRSVEDGKPMKYIGANCLNAPPFPLPQFVDCEQANEGFKATVVRARAPDGRDALAIRTSAKSAGIDSVVTYTRRLFIDPVTYLPIATVRHASDRYAGGDYTQKSTSTEEFTFTFVAPTTLPAHFFDPASIGYTED